MQNILLAVNTSLYAWMKLRELIRFKTSLGFCMCVYIKRRKSPMYNYEDIRLEDGFRFSLCLLLVFLLLTWESSLSVVWWPFLWIEYCKFNVKCVHLQFIRQCFRYFLTDCLGEMFIHVRSCMGELFELQYTRHLFMISLHLSFVVFVFLWGFLMFFLRF